VDLELGEVDLTSFAIHTTLTTLSLPTGDCFDIITVNTSAACPNSQESDTVAGTTGGNFAWFHPGGFPSTTTTTNSKPIGKIIAMAIGSFVGTAILCTICVCCCVRRQERLKQRKQFQEMQNISTQQTQSFVPQFAAAQPYPGTQQMPYPYPQYYFYYPPQGQPAAKPQATQPAPPVVPLEVQMSDEQLAKKLQAEFDKEAHN